MGKRNIIEQIAIENITRSTLEAVDGLSKEAIIDLLVQSRVELHKTKEVAEMRRNALFLARSEHIQLSLFDASTLEPVDPENDFEQKTDELREALLLAKEEAQENLNCILKKEEHLNSVEGRRKKSKKCRSRERIDETVVYDVKDRTCPVCGEEMVHLGYTSRIKIKYIPSKTIVVEEKYETVICPNKCEDENNKTVIKSAKPEEPDLIDKSPITESLVAGLVYDKFILGVPLYRSEKNFASFNIPLSRQTMGNVINACYSSYLIPVIEKMKEDLRQLNVVHMDETPLQCLELKDRKTSWMVCASSGRHEEKQMTIYSFFEGRQQTFVAAVLGASYSKALMSDGLQGYRNYDGCVKLSCMAHARRKFYDALICRDDHKALMKILGKKDADDVMTPAVDYLTKHPALNILLTSLRLISSLYYVEERFYDLPLDAVKEARQQISVAVFEKLTGVVEEIHDGFEEGTLAWKAADYFLSRKDELIRYTEEGIYPIDNNLAERKVKPFVMARKNFLFTNSVEGANSAAAYMTLLISAEQNGLNQFRYLTYLLNRLKYYKETPVPADVLADLLPYSGNLPKELYIDPDTENEAES